MKAATPVKQDIFELVLDFYRKPSAYPDLLDSMKPLPEGITDLLELTAGEVEARAKILSRAAATEAPSELVDATSYFSEQVLFAPGGDHYRILGLNHDSNIDDIREHYALLVRLFYQDREDNSIQSNEADLSRLNRAYSILRDDKKRAEYIRSLEIQGRLRRPVTEESNEAENISQVTATNVQPIDSYVSSRKKNNASESMFVEDDGPGNVEVAGSRGKAKSTSSSVSVNNGLPKILIIDDSATVRAGLSLTLNKEFDCITAKDGERGWKKLQQMDDILLVLTDLEMPKLDGYALIKRIRTNPDKRLKAMPVIVVTGTDDIDTKQKAISSGADDFLAKSTDYIEVLTRVRVHYRLVKTKQQLSESRKSESRRKPAQQTELSSRLDTGPDSHYLAKKTAYSRSINGTTEYLGPKTGFKNIITIGAFAVVAVMLVSLLYFTQIKPAGEKNVVINDVPQNTIKVPLPLKPTSEISRIDTETAIPTDDVKKNNKEKTSQEAGKVEKSNATSNTKPHISEPVTQFKSPTSAELILKEESEVNKRIIVTPPIKKKVVTEVTKAPTLTRSTTTTATTPSFGSTVSNQTKRFASALDNEQTQSLPETKITPPVTPFDDISPDSVPKSTIAFVDDPVAPFIIAKPKISQRELALLIFRFIRSYEDGNLFQFMRLFSKNAKTEDRSDRLSIEADYKDLFRKSAARRFILGNLDWKYDNDTAKGNGFFEVKIWPKGGDQFKTFTGEVTIEVLKTEAEGLVITGLFHQF